MCLPVKNKRKVSMFNILTLKKKFMYHEPIKCTVMRLGHSVVNEASLWFICLHEICK